MSHTVEREPIWTTPFVRVFAASFFIEVAWSLTIHLPRFFEDLGASEGQIGLLYAVASAFGLAFRPMVGRLLDLWGRKPLLITAGVVEVVFLATYLLLEAWGAPAFANRIVQASAQLVLFTAIFTYVADSLPASRRAQGLGLFGLTGLIPIGVGGLLGDVVIAAGGFRALFVTAALSATIGVVTLMTLPVLSTHGDDDAARRSVWSTLRQRDLVPIWVLALSFAVGLEAIFVFMATFIEEVDIGSAGLFFGLYSVSAVTVRLIGSGWTDRFGYRRVVTPSFVVFTSAFLLLAFTGNVVTLAAAGLMGGTGHGILFPAIGSQVIERARATERGSAVAMFTALFDLAILVGAPIVGRVIDTIGYRVAFAGIGCTVFVGLIAFLLLDNAVRRDDAAGWTGVGSAPV